MSNNTKETPTHFSLPIHSVTPPLFSGHRPADLSNPMALSPSSNDEDRISSLSDDILSHIILPYLPTKDAVSTSILSTRWRYVWTLVPTLDFDDSIIPNSENRSPNVSFMNFVDRVLFLRNTTIKIQKFHLSCHHECDPSRFNTWISFVNALDVPDVSLSYFCPTKDYVYLPRSLYACKMLEELKLNRDFHMDFPDSVCLPSLRVLHLISVYFDDSCFENLIRSCPVLEELVIDNMDKNYSFSNVKICLSSLKSLKIHSEIYGPGNLSIDAPSLEYIDIAGHIFGHYYVSTLSSVVKAIVDVYQDYPEALDEEEDPLYIGVVDLFWGICNVKHLTILSPTVAYIFSLRNRPMPKFCNLTHLEVCIPNMGSLPALLECTSEVTNLVIAMDCFECLDSCPERWWDKPDCMQCLSKRAIIEIRGSFGDENKMKVAKAMVIARYFLQNSMTLKEMSVGIPKMSLKEKSKARKKLLRCLRGSRNCTIVFS